MRKSKAGQLLLAACFLLLVAGCAQLDKMVPTTPVPMTAALAAVLLAGAALEKKTALLSMAAYLLLGVLGVPVFPGMEGGPHLLSGPAGGFLLSYPLVAVMVSFLTERRGRGFLRYLASMAAALPVYYLIGVGQLLVITKAGLYNSLRMGVLPFWAADLLKCAAAALLAALLDRAARGKGVGKTR